MTGNELLIGLNEPQAQAVTYTGGPLLVMAGAGSGKTRVLTHRVAYLLANSLAQPWQILAITFTNKAAAEMRERLARLIGDPAKELWVATFHSTCVRILRREAQAAGLTSAYSIYDSTDSLRMITQICKELNFDPKQWRPRGFASRYPCTQN